jgi:hypothetical protein
MDADDWLKTIEKKLQVVQCNNRERVLLASQQLVGPVADWWDAYVEAHEEPTPSITMSSRCLSALIMYLEALSSSRRRSSII